MIVIKIQTPNSIMMSVLNEPTWKDLIRLTKSNQNFVRALFTSNFVNYFWGKKCTNTCKSCFAASAPALVWNVTKPTGWKTKFEIALQFWQKSRNMLSSIKILFAHRCSLSIFIGDFQQGSLIALQKETTKSIETYSDSFFTFHFQHLSWQ